MIWFHGLIEFTAVNDLKVARDPYLASAINILEAPNNYVAARSWEMRPHYQHQRLYARLRYSDCYR